MIHMWIGIAGVVLGGGLFFWAVSIRWRNWDDWATSMVMNNFAFISGIIGFVELLIWWLTDKQVPQ